MKIWSITNWTTDSPHWSVAYIEAKTAKRAADILENVISSEDRDTIWSHEVKPRSEWQVKEYERPFVFILGSGCR
jgi:hypothetical protein